jgi:hypothetical protein
LTHAKFLRTKQNSFERFNRTLDSFLAEADLKKAGSLSDFNHLFDVWLTECYHSKEHSGINATPESAYKSSKTPLRFLTAETVARAFLHSEKRKVDKSGCISFRSRKYEVGVVYEFCLVHAKFLIGRTVDVVYEFCLVHAKFLDPADVSVLTVEDKHFNTSFQIKELVVMNFRMVRSIIAWFTR